MKGGGLARRGARARWAALACGVALSLAVVEARAAEQGAVEDAEVRAAVERVLSDPSYERQLPDKVRQAPPRSPERGVRRYRRTGASPAREPVSSGSGLSQALVVTLFSVVGVALALWLGREFARWRGLRGTTVAPGVAGQQALDEATRAVLARMPATLHNARALAAAGRLEEAVRLLLRGAIDDVGELGRVAVTPDLTSRELLGRASLEPPSRQAFAALVVAVERSLFAGEAVSADAFERCAAAFDHLHGRLAAR